MKDDAISHLSDQTMALTDRIQDLGGQQAMPKKDLNNVLHHYLCRIAIFILKSKGLWVIRLWSQTIMCRRLSSTEVQT